MKDGTETNKPVNIGDEDIDRLCAMAALTIDKQERERLVFEVSQIVGFARAVCDAAEEEGVEIPQKDPKNVQRADVVSEWDGEEILSPSHRDGAYVRIPRMME